MDSDLYKARVYYEDLGFDTLPLHAGSKKPIFSGWQNRPIHRLWHKVPSNFNIGIRGGGVTNLAIIDCDESRTFRSISTWLEGLGYQADSYPTVQTASGEGRHIYVSLSGGFPGDWRTLSKEIGAGEFRYGSGSYVVAPPSLIAGGGEYILQRGDFSLRPTLSAKDILQIVDNKDLVTEHEHRISRKALALLRGKGIDKYKSRSEADQALLTSLCNGGFTFYQVLDFFNRYPCAGKYAELKAKNPKNAISWLSKSYDEALRWTQTHESKQRQFAESAIEWAESTGWQGKTGAVDRSIFIAHAEIMKKAGRWIYAASSRDLAEEAGVSHMTATRATWRLTKSGLIIPDKRAVGDCANCYQLGKVDMTLHSPGTPAVRKCNSMSAHDVFRFAGLGKSAMEVFSALLDKPASIDDLAGTTKRHPKTIKRVLDRMGKLADPLTGECIPMVACDKGKCYRAMSVDLDRIAQAIGTAGMGERQKMQYTKDRRLRARALERARNRGK